MDLWRQWFGHCDVVISIKTRLYSQSFRAVSMTMQDTQFLVWPQTAGIAKFYGFKTVSKHLANYQISHEISLRPRNCWYQSEPLYILDQMPAIPWYQQQFQDSKYHESITRSRRWYHGCPAMQLAWIYEYSIEWWCHTLTIFFTFHL